VVRLFRRGMRLRARQREPAMPVVLQVCHTEVRDPVVVGTVQPRLVCLLLVWVPGGRKGMRQGDGMVQAGWKCAGMPALPAVRPRRRRSRFQGAGRQACGGGVEAGR